MYKANGVAKKRRWPKILKVILAVILLAAAAFGVYRVFFYQTVEEKIENQVSFDSSFTASEQEQVRQAIKEQNLQINSPVNAKVTISQLPSNQASVLEVYVPVTNVYSVTQKVTIESLSGPDIVLLEGTDPVVSSAVAGALGEESASFQSISEANLTEISENSVAFVPFDKLSSELKLLWLDGNYYLDTFNSGAFFREVVFEGEGAGDLASLKLNELLDKESVYKVNITGVTALTRVMMRKLSSVGDPLYFSEKIGDFLADADLTHVSNEVSFKEGCGYSNTLFCSPPAFIETLKDSGVDLVELTGNHNNDVGSMYNTETINLYKSLGWGTVGGGLNTVEAAKSYPVETKGSKVTFLAYNYPDSPNGGAIAGADKAGANSFDFAKIESDIAAAKQNSDFVVVNIQYWECYAYPNGYVEFPECDAPIGQQEEVFKKVADLGANMVVGSSAHQPQTYEIYNGTAIYYGLGNLYFDQTSWPGTERGIVLSNYFLGGKLIQTKLTPTVYDRDLQTRIMTDEEADYLLRRLHAAR